MALKAYIRDPGATIGPGMGLEHMEIGKWRVYSSYRGVCGGCKWRSVITGRQSGWER